MFLALDECYLTAEKITLIGCLVLPTEQLAEIEQSFINNRIAHNCWGEVKWGRSSAAYGPKYEKFLTDYLANDQVTFHSWAYKVPTAAQRREYYPDTPHGEVIFKHAYLLIRTIIWKCRNNGYTGPFYILSDESTLGHSQYALIQKYLSNDSQIKPSPEIEFCSIGNSTVVGALQVSDICTAAAADLYRRTPTAGHHRSIVSCLEAINGGLPLTYSPPKLPELYSQKFHHFAHRIPA